MKFFLIIFVTFLASSNARVIKRQIGFGFPQFGQQQQPFGFAQPGFFFPGQFGNQQQFPNQQQQGQQFPNQQQQGQQFPNQQQQGQQFPNQQQQGQQFPNQQQQGQQFPNQQQSTTLPPQVLSCIERCIETTHSSYNPVCGSDMQNYHNQERFDCANDCGARLTKIRNGVCPSRNETTQRPTK